MTHLNEIMLYALVRTIMRTTAHRTNSNDVVETFAIKCFIVSWDYWQRSCQGESYSTKQIQDFTPDQTEPNQTLFIISSIEWLRDSKSFDCVLLQKLQSVFQKYYYARRPEAAVFTLFCSDDLHPFLFFLLFKWGAARTKYPPATTSTTTTENSIMTFWWLLQRRSGEKVRCYAVSLLF